jgi:hypothetical protein
MLVDLILGLGAWSEYVRVTYYTLPGRMYNGETVHLGAAACSAWIPLESQLRLPDGWVVTCKDRGLGDRYWRGWVDIWAPNVAWGRRYVEADYGLFAWVDVVRWGHQPIEIDEEIEE